MGKFHLSFNFFKMFQLLFLLPVVFAGVLKEQSDHAHIRHEDLPKPLGDSTGNVEYKPIEPEHYNPREIYKAGNMDDCHWVEKLVYKDECVPYTEKRCYTQQREHCKDVYQKNCTAVIDEFEERECFDVKELVCQLAEVIDYEMVEETFTVQRCTRVNDRVCDTVYDLDKTTKDDFQCVEIEHQKCWEEDKVVKDRTCVYSVDFECGKAKKHDGKGSVTCEKVPTKKCYDTPRKVREEVCKPKVSKYCEKFTNEFPFPVQKQNCHNEPMKKCELETRSRPKKAKKYNYVKECKEVKRQVCDDCEKKKLRPVCDKIQKNVCSYKPEETCEEEHKKYCFKSEMKLKEKVCAPNKKEIVDETLRYV